MSRLLVLFALVLSHWAIVPASAVTRSMRTRTKRSDDASPLEAVVQTLGQQVTENNAKIAALEAKLNKAEISVAFHAELSSDPVTLSAHAHVVFNNVRTNAGSGYDGATGYFRAPVSGSYMFVANFMGALNTQLYLAVFVDGVRVDYSLSHASAGTWDHVSESLVVHLTAGQRVHMQNDSGGSSRSIRGGHWSTFSGFLIQADP